MDTNDPGALRDEMRAHLARGSTVQVNVDVRAPGVRLPDGVVRDAADGRVILMYGPPHRLNVPIPDLDIGDAGVTATLSFSRVPAATFVPWAAVRGLFADAPRPAELCCALCGRVRAQVGQLVAGEPGAVCNGCVPFALSILDSDPAARPRWRTLLACTDVMLGDLAPATPPADSGPLLTAAVALAAGDLAWSRAIASHAMRLGQPAIALAIIDGIDGDARVAGDRIVRFGALVAMGRVAEAHAERAALDDAGLSEPQRGVLAEHADALRRKLDPPG